MSGLADRRLGLMAQLTYAAGYGECLSNQTSAGATNEAHNAGGSLFSRISGCNRSLPPITLFIPEIILGLMLQATSPYTPRHWQFQSSDSCMRQPCSRVAVQV